MNLLVESLDLEVCLCFCWEWFVLVELKNAFVSAGGERGKKWQERVRFSSFWLGQIFFFLWGRYLHISHHKKV